MNRRALIQTAPLLAVAGCAALANAPATVATAGAQAITTIAAATNYWGGIKGEVQVAILGVSLLNPALGASLTAGLAVGDALVAALPTLAADATTLASGIASLVQHGAALFVQAIPKIKVIPNGVTT
jgi:hypothetical protein